MSTALVKDLTGLLPPDRVSDAPDELSRVSGDALAAYRAFQRTGEVEVLPAALVSPTRVEEVAAVAAYASQRGIPLVPRGGGTGVMGGAVPVEGAIVVELRGMDTVHEIDREGRRVTVGAGAILEDVEDALIRRGLLLGHDPWSRPIATVGGAISTNGMGYLAGKYGSMGEQVLGLQVVLGTGEVIETPGVPKVAGPDVDSLFVGAEGAMGIITRATLSAFAQPEERHLCAYRFTGFIAGYNAVQEMHAIGLRPAMVDFDEEFPRDPIGQPDESETTLYLSFEGYREEVAAQRERGHRICTAAGGELLPAEEVEEFWRERHSSAERYKREVLQHGHAARDVAGGRGAWTTSTWRSPRQRCLSTTTTAKPCWRSGASPCASGRCGAGLSTSHCSSRTPRQRRVRTRRSWDRPWTTSCRRRRTWAARWSTATAWG